jgi:oxygen-independent coproporphyrinogen III oxidase
MLDAGTAPSVDVGIYAHVPFCLQRCTYCDFNTYTGLLSLEDAYVTALMQEVRLRTERAISLRARTLYFGGGTPSLLDREHVASLVETVQREMRLPWGAEVTLEANPGTVTAGYLVDLLDAGVTRLSLGVQSSHSRELIMLGRIHTWQEAVDSFTLAREAGFGNISLDLMFGLPDQSLAEWIETLHRCLDLGPDHLSLYALTLEPGTPLAETLMLNEVELPDGDLAADMYEAASEELHSAGFWQYEISNWARGSVPPSEVWGLPPEGRSEGIGPYVCAHNLIYWRNEPWIGLGAGAHSWFRGRRWSNQPHPRAYINGIRSERLGGYGEEAVPRATVCGEMMMMGLRLAEGICDAHFAAISGSSLQALYGPAITQFSDLGLVTWDDDRLRLTARGRLLGNQVFEAFLLTEDEAAEWGSFR